MRLITVILLLFTFKTAVLPGQDIVITVEVPSVVAVGEQIRLMYRVNTSGGELKEPPFEGFYKLSGPNTSYSMSTRIINGKITTETSYSYVYYLQATREGTYTIPPAVYEKGRKTYTSDEVIIEVVRDPSSKTPATTGNEKRGAETPAAGSDMFAKVLLSSREIYLGEAVVATVKYYTRVDISGVNEIKYPSFNGFMKEEIETPQPRSLVTENIDGVNYGTGVFQRFLLYPQRTGEITIDPVQISVLIRQRGGLSDPFFGDFFQTFNTVPRLVESDRTSIKVKPLPEGKPASFTGAVGTFDLKASLDKDTTAVNDALTLTVTISGQGNIKLTDAPVISFPSGLETYDPKTTTKVANRETGSSGNKIFEYLIIPRSAGTYTIPKIEWSFFNPAKNQYQTIASRPLSFHVLKSEGPPAAGPALYTPAPGEDIKYYGTDIRFIKSKIANFSKSGDKILSNRSFYAIYGFSLFAFITIVLLRRGQVKRNADRVKVLNRKAGRVATKRLGKASSYLAGSEYDAFYEEIMRALWGYTSDKLNIPLSELTARRAEEELNRRDTDMEIVQMLIELTEICEQVMYAPVSEASEPHAVYQKASRLIRTMEEKLN